MRVAGGECGPGMGYSRTVRRVQRQDTLNEYMVSVLKVGGLRTVGEVKVVEEQETEYSKVLVVKVES